MNITIEQARRLYREAHAFYLGTARYMGADSEIRQIAERVFLQQSNISHLMTVCAEIFRVLAEAYMDEINRDQPLQQLEEAKAAAQRRANLEHQTFEVLEHAERQQFRVQPKGFAPTPEGWVIHSEVLPESDQGHMDGLSPEEGPKRG